MKKRALCFLMALVLAACSAAPAVPTRQPAAPATAVIEATSAPTLTLAPTHTALPATPTFAPPTQTPTQAPPTATPTDTPEPLIPVAAGTPVPGVVGQPLAPTQLDALQEVARFDAQRPTGLAWSPDGTQVAIATWGGVFLYNLPAFDSGTRLFKNLAVLKAAYSPDGHSMLLVTQDGSFQARSLPEGSLIVETQMGVPDRYTQIALNSARKIAAVSSIDLGTRKSSIRVWNYTGGEPTEFAVSGDLTSLALSDDGSLLAAGQRDGKIQLFQTRGGELETCQFHTGQIVGLAFSSDASLLFSTSADQSLRSCDLTSHRQQLMLAAPRPLTLLRYAPAAPQVLTAGLDGELRLINSGNGALGRLLKGHTAAVRDAAFSPDGTHLVTLSEDGSIRLWDAKSGALLKTVDVFPTAITSLDISPAGDWIAAGYHDDSVRIWDTATRTLLRRLRPGSGGSYFINDVLISPSGKRLLTVEANILRLWDPTSGRLLHTMKDHTDSVLAASFSANEKWLATASADRSIILWDAASGRPLHAYTAFRGPVAGVRFSDDSTELTSVDWDEGIKTWLTQGGGLQQIVSGGPGPDIERVIFSPDGGFFASLGGGRVQLWHTQDGIARWSSGDRIVNVVSFSNSGEMLVTGGKELSFLNLQTGWVARSIPARSWISTLRFSRDGSLLVTGDYDSGSISFWRVMP